MDDYNRQANDARLGVTQAGGQEQQRMNDMAAQRAGFQNAAQQQAYSRSSGAASSPTRRRRSVPPERRWRPVLQRRPGAGLAQNQSVFNAQNVQRNQYMKEQYALRNQPINEITRC